MAMPAQLISPPPSEATTSPKRKWPVDITALAIVTGILWVITYAWHIFDLGHSLNLPIHSESDAWLLTLSGIILIWLLLAWVVSWWGVILGIPNCLLVINLGLRRLPAKQRWLIAVAITSALFTLLNHYGITRSPTLQEAKKTDTKSTVGQAAEVPGEMAPNVVPAEEELDAMSRAVDAKCGVSKDPDFLAACARYREGQKWELR